MGHMGYQRGGDSFSWKEAFSRGGSRKGGEILGVPKTSKRGDNVACVRVNAAHFSTFRTVSQTPLSEILYPPLPFP